MTDYVAMADADADAQGERPGGALGLYRQFLSRSMWSRCRWLPSDSNYFRRVRRSCGPAFAAFLSAARILAEPDSARLGKHVVVYGRRVRWIDLAPRCE